MTTKEKILKQALILFSEHGYEGVSVAMIAERCSIKAPSLYKHFKSKKEIFEEVYNHSCKKLDAVISQIALKESEEKNISEEILFQKQKEIVNLLIHDDEIKRLRCLMKLSNDSQIKSMYSKRFFDQIINYHATIFSSLIEKEIMINESPSALALLYDSPIIVAIDELDRHPEREEELLMRLYEHCKLFIKLVTIT
ncbi:TetR/AcrR family transcriptional regulator [Bullifex sp.]|uniref:TetR/AcrR family transcriptional regulator n=1 Tax=Bullifex sp. TaxID=2815808 RepID=UPI002A80D59F|nr:TetR/AcrR family transcriptional regulator [Bullifex sp.]MDY4066805.1 TetR/AcrR family transcriptional regulator [Bullifex sp.]